MALLKLLVLVAVIGAVACDDLDASRRRLAPKEPAVTEDPNFQEVKKVPCDEELNNFCGSIPTPISQKEGEGFFYPG